MLFAAAARRPDPALKRCWQQARCNPKNAWDKRRSEHVSAQRRRKRRRGDGGAKKKRRRQRQRAGKQLAAEQSRGHEVMCVVCCDHPRNTALMPCRHLVLCSGCAGDAKQKPCPICRGSVEEVLSFFLS